MSEILLSITAGLVLFLFAITNLSDTLKAALGNNAQHWIKKYTSNSWSSLLVGIVITTLLDSSSATVGMAIILSKKGLISLTGGIAVMLGAELGTCSDTLLATIKGSRQALKTGLFHVTFNLLSIALGLALFFPFTALVKIISGGASVERTLANAHMLFNIFGVLIFIGTIPFFEKQLNRLLPDKIG
jgi:phosphate:Na+ symporter